MGRSSAPSASVEVQVSRTRRSRKRALRHSNRDFTEQQTMVSNRGVVYVGPGKVDVRSIDFRKLVDPRGKRCDHGVILKVVSTNICGSDQHMVRGRTTAQPGLVLGHE